MVAVSHHVLIAIDDSESALKTVSYAASILDKNTRITLFHVLYRVPYKDLEDDPTLAHYPLFEQQVESLKTWLSQQRGSADGLMTRVKDLLIERGFAPQNIRVKIEERKTSVAGDILEELTEGEYDTVVVGRRQKSGTRHFLMGSVSSKIVQHAENCAVWVVE
jgi:nucleotide-binding universal stress UspA family protein